MTEPNVRKTHDLDVRHDTTGQRMETTLRCERDSAPIDDEATRRRDELVRRSIIDTAINLPAVATLRDVRGRLTLSEKSLAVLELDYAQAQHEQPRASGKSSGEAIAATAVKTMKNKQSLKERLETMREGVSILHADVLHAEAIAKDAIKEHLVTAFTTVKDKLREQEQAAKDRLREMVTVLDELSTIDRVDVLVGNKAWHQKDRLIEEIMSAVNGDGSGE